MCLACIRTEGEWLGKLLLSCILHYAAKMGFYNSEKLCAFASLREKTLNRDEWIGSETAAVKGAGV